MRRCRGEPPAADPEHDYFRVPGTIYDRNGETLAISATADTIFLDPKMIQERADELDKERAEALTKGMEDGESLPITGEE